MKLTFNKEYKDNYLNDFTKSLIDRVSPKENAHNFIPTCFFVPLSVAWVLNIYMRFNYLVDKHWTTNTHLETTKI